MNRDDGASAATAVRHGERGVMLLATLLVLALLGIGLMVGVDVWSVSRQRERERELLFVGDQYRQAIRRYYLVAPPGGGRSLPPSVAVLLDDDRFPIPVHHLRRAYPDPMSGAADWGLLRAGDRIIGVYSTSDKHPIKQAGFPPPYLQFEEAQSYRDWVFAFQIPRAGRVPPPRSPASGVSPTAPAVTTSPPGRPS